MYIWLAIDIEDQLQNVRRLIGEAEDKYCTRDPALTLPLHISLKISFKIDNFLEDQVRFVAREYFSALDKFEIEPDEIESCGNLTWIKMKKSRALEGIHNSLDKLMTERFGVSQHTFDQDFIFHATLFANTDPQLINAAIKQINLPKKFMANRFIIGSSDNGLAGSYSVDEYIVI